MQPSHIAVGPADFCKNSFSLLCFDFEVAGSVQFAYAKDLKSFYQLIQMDGLESKTNSWFLNNQVISDGKLIGLLPALPGWIYFNLYGQCKSARSVFITVEDVLADWAEQDGADSEVLTANYRSASASIDAFLEKLLPGQVNYEGNMGFRWEEDKIVASLMNLLQSASNNENLDAGDAVKSSHLGQKWSNYPNKDRLILALESFLPYLPNSISSMLLQKLEMTPTAISKQLKPNETIVKAISAKPNFELPDHLAPTSDYSITEKKSKSDKKPAAPQDKNQKSINSFFLKAQK